MNSSVLAVVLVVVAVGAGALVVADPSPGEMPGPGAGDATTAKPTTTATSAADDSASGYDFTIEEIEECGSTCRDVTAVLANTGSETRRNVEVTTKVYADGDLLWTGNETVGTLDAGEAHTSTKRVDVGLTGGMKIQDNDGYVTIVTVVRSDAGTTEFSERRKAS